MCARKKLYDTVVDGKGRMDSIHEPFKEFTDIGVENLTESYKLAHLYVHPVGLYLRVCAFGNFYFKELQVGYDLVLRHVGPFSQLLYIVPDVHIGSDFLHISRSSRSFERIKGILDYI